MLNLIISYGVTGLQNMLLLGKGRYFIKSLLLPELNDCANFAPTEQTNYSIYYKFYSVH